MRQVSREEVQRLVSEGAQLVEVLDAPQYDDEHLPGAVNLPLTQLDGDSAARLATDRPIVVYCHDAA